MGDVSVWQNGFLKTDRAPASGELAVGNGTDFDLTQSNITFGNPLVIGVPVTVNGIVWSTTGGFKFPDNSVQTSAATTYSPPTYANNTIVANYSGSVAAPTGYSLSTILDDVFGTTQGTVLYRGASTWAALPPGTLGQFLQTQGASANPAWASASPWILVTKTTDQSFTSTTVAPDSALQFTLAANTKYKIRFHIDMNAGTPGSGFKITTYGPASPTAIYTAGGIYWSDTFGGTYDSPASLYGGTSGSNTNYGQIQSYYLSSPYAATFFEIYISNGANAGTFGLSFGLDNGTGILAVKAGSYLEYTTF